MPRRKSTYHQPSSSPGTGVDSGFAEIVTLKHILPLPVAMLCRLTGITPDQLMDDFMSNLSRGVWKREGREEARRLLAAYFVECGYGRGRFSAAEIASMFDDMDAMGRLYPAGDVALADFYTEWRGRYFQWWFDKWTR